jgi:hypothetical protein
MLPARSSDMDFTKKYTKTEYGRDMTEYGRDIRRVIYKR